MALRYSGSRKGRNLWSGTIGAPKSSRLAVDSPEAYDETAHAALSFAAHDGADMDDMGTEVTRQPQTRVKKRVNPSRKRPASKRARKAAPRRRASRR